MTNEQYAELETAIAERLERVPMRDRDDVRQETWCFLMSAIRAGSSPDIGHAVNQARKGVRIGGRRLDVRIERDRQAFVRGVSRDAVGV